MRLKYIQNKDGDCSSVQFLILKCKISCGNSSLMAVANKKQVQPIYEWGLDPIHWTYAKLFIRDVFGLGENKIIAGKAVR